VGNQGNVTLHGICKRLGIKESLEVCVMDFDDFISSEACVHEYDGIRC
jgi:hypothetical protein